MLSDQADQDAEEIIAWLTVYGPPSSVAIPSGILSERKRAPRNSMVRTASSGPDSTTNGTTLHSPARIQPAWQTHSPVPGGLTEKLAALERLVPRFIDVDTQIQGHLEE